jgi:hypothetical protein
MTAEGTVGAPTCSLFNDAPSPPPSLRAYEPWAEVAGVGWGRVLCSKKTGFGKDFFAM